MPSADPHPRPSERSFGLTLGTVLLTLGALGWWQGGALGPTIAGGAGGILVAAALGAPPLLRVPNRIWWRFAQALGWVNARILLSLLFALVLTPMGVVMRALGRSPLRDAAADTNWSPYTARRRDVKHYEHPY